MRTCFAVLLLALTGSAAPAEGAVVELRADDETRDGPLVLVTAAPGERNEISAFATSVGGTLRAEIKDAGAALTAGAGCTQAGADTVHCATPDFPDLEVEAGDGDDTVDEQGTFHFVTVNGGAGDDEISIFEGGVAGGGAGDDRLRGSPGPDRFEGGPGNDVLDGFDGEDALEGGDDDDTVRGGGQIDTVNGGNEYAPGAGGDDRLLGGAGNDFLDDDDSRGGVGPDHLDGGSGRDLTFSYSSRHRRVRVNLQTGEHAGEGGENDTLRSIEGVWAGEGDDLLLGSGADEELRGGEGSDVIRSRGGDDSLEVGNDDRVAAGRGDDRIHGDDFEAWDGRAACGPGRDQLTSYFWEYRAPFQDEQVPGPLVQPSCEAIAVFDRLRVDPVPDRSGGRQLVFRFPVARGRVLTLTEPARPFKEIASRPVRGERVAMRIPRRFETGSVLRAAVTRRGEGGTPVEWRFKVPG